MSLAFEHHTLGQRVRFGSQAAAQALSAEFHDGGWARAMVLAAPAEADLAAKITTGLPVAHVHDEVVMHVPVPVAERARDAAATHDVDVLVSVGGGSTTGLAKAVALTTGLPIIAVPTTYAGSEATDVWGLTEEATKTTGVDPRVLPRTVVYDASLMVSLPVELSVASGLNALAHCVDSMWSPRTDPIDQALAAEGIRALDGGLPRIVADPTDLGGREEALYGAYLSAVAFASAGSGLHHKICHVLGGRYDLPHAATHAVVLPYVLALNGPAAPAADDRIARAFGASDGLAGLQGLRARLDAPRALRGLGFEESQIPDAARAILPAVPPSNPAEVSVAVLEDLLHRAWEGADPR